MFRSCNSIFLTLILSALSSVVVSPPAAALDTYPELIQVNTPAPTGGVNEFIQGPFVEGVTAGNIVYALHNFSQSGSSSLNLFTPGGGHHTYLSTSEPKFLMEIYGGNGGIYPLQVIEPTRVITFDGSNGPVLNEAALRNCPNAWRFLFFEGVPLLLSTNQLYLPDHEGNCFFTGYILNADLTMEITPSSRSRIPAQPEEDFLFIHERTAGKYDPIDRMFSRIEGDQYFFDLQTGQNWTGLSDWAPLRRFDPSHGFLIQRRLNGGSAIVWLDDRKEPAPNFSSPLEGFMRVGARSPDLDPYVQPIFPDAQQVLATAGVAFDTGTAGVKQSADRFVLISWKEAGVTHWGTFKYGIFGKINTPYATVPENTEIIVRHVRDGIGCYFNEDDLIYPFSIPDKKNPDLTIPVNPDGSFSHIGVLAGTYELTLFINGQPVGVPTILNYTGKYTPVTITVTEMTGISGDQTYQNGVNISDGNLVEQNTDLLTFLQNFTFVRTYNSLDEFQDLNLFLQYLAEIKRGGEPEDILVSPLGKGWTHNFNLMILNSNPDYWWGNLNVLPDTFVILLDEDGRLHTFITPLPYVKQTRTDERGFTFEYIKLIQVENGSGPMELIQTGPSGFILTRNNGTRFAFDSFGKERKNAIARLISIEVPSIGDAVSVNYTGGRARSDPEKFIHSPQTVMLDSNRGGAPLFTFLYEEDEHSPLYATGLITAVVNSFGQKTEFSYELGGPGDVNDHTLLKEVKIPGVDPIIYDYDDQNRLIRISQGQWFNDIHYNSLNRVVAVNPPVAGVNLDYQTDGKRTTVTDADGNVTTYDYSDWKIRDIGGLANSGGRVNSFTDPLAFTTLVNWSSNGNLLRMVEPNGHLSQASYDELSRLLEFRASEPVVFTYPENTGDFDPRASLPVKISGISPASIHLEYDNDGNPTKRTFGEHEINIERNKFGQVTKYVDPSFGNTGLDYNDSGLLAEISGPTTTTKLGYGQGSVLGRPDNVKVTPATGPPIELSFSYDPAGRPTGQTGLAVDLGGDVSNVTTSFTYDGRGNVTSITDPRRSKTEYQYTNFDRVSRVSLGVSGVGTITRQTAYDARGRRSVETDPNGNAKSFGYDPVGRISRLQRGMSGDPSAPAGIAEFSYTSTGRVSEIRHGDGDELESFNYNLEGLMTENTHSSPEISTQFNAYQYDKYQRLTHHVAGGAEPADPKLNLDVNYDDVNRPILQSVQTGSVRFDQELTYDQTRSLVTHIQSNDHITDLSYDPASRPTQVVDRNTASGIAITTQTAYDGYGNVTNIGNSGGRPPTKIEYNALGLPLKTTQGRYTADLSYDPGGNVVEMTDALGNRLTRTVDERGLPLTETLNGRTTAFSYDPNGNVIKRVDPDGLVTEYEYNQHDGVRTMTTPKADIGGVNPVDIVTTFAYDEHGMPVEMKRDGRTQAFSWSRGNLMSMTDEAGRNWNYGRDAFGNLTRLEVDGKLLSAYENDGLGNRTAEIDAAGRRTMFKHDSRGNVIERVDPGGTGTKMKYDPAGNMVERASGGRVEKWEYTGGELLTRTATPEGDIAYTYDADGNLTGIRANGALTASLDYKTDVAGRITEIRGPGGVIITYAYDPEGRVTSVTDGSGRKTEIEYDVKGRERKRILPNGEIVEKEYNGLDWLLKQTHTLKGRVFVRTWEYDAAGREIGYAEDDEKSTYGYDESGRLLSVLRPDNAAISYVYDSAGNMVEVGGTGEKAKMAYDAANRLVRSDVTRLTPVAAKNEKPRGKGTEKMVKICHRPPGNPSNFETLWVGEPAVPPHLAHGDYLGPCVIENKFTYLYEHDPEGQLIRTRQLDENGNLVPNGERLFVWDGVGRLSEARQGSEVVGYTYDAEGRLIQRKTNTLTSKFVWDVTSENILAELNAANQVVATYVPTRTQDDVIVKQNLTLNKTAIYSDFAFNLPTKTVRDEFGNTIETLETPEPYGAMQTASTVDHTRFQGKMQDPVTGLYYFRNRWYDPQARRFVSQDPTPVDEFQPDKIHRYAAFGLNPISNVDPMGADHLTMAHYNQVRASASAGNANGILAWSHLRDIRVERLALKDEEIRAASSRGCTPWKNWMKATDFDLRFSEHRWWFWWKYGSRVGMPQPSDIFTADVEYRVYKNFTWVPEYLECYRWEAPDALLETENELLRYVIGQTAGFGYTVGAGIFGSAVAQSVQLLGTSANLMRALNDARLNFTAKRIGGPSFGLERTAGRINVDVINEIKALPSSARLTSRQLRELEKNIDAILLRSLPKKVAGGRGADIVKLFRDDPRFRFLDQTLGGRGRVSGALARYGLTF